MTLNESIQELERELSLRKRIYPDWIWQQKIDKKTAKHRIEAMDFAIKILKSHTPVQTNLFTN